MTFIKISSKNEVVIVTHNWCSVPTVSKTVYSTDIWLRRNTKAQSLSSEVTFTGCHRGNTKKSTERQTKFVVRWIKYERNFTRRKEKYFAKQKGSFVRAHLESHASKKTLSVIYRRKFFTRNFHNEYRQL